MSLNTAIVDQRTVMYNAYLLLVGDEDRYKTFKSADIAKILDIDTVYVSAVVMKCIRAGLIARTGKEGRAGLYKLTKAGINRGEYYFKYWNPITNEMIE